MTPRIRALALDKIRSDGGTQTRAAIRRAITDYAQAMVDGVPSHPSWCSGTAQTTGSGTGFHRVAAARRARADGTGGHVRQGTRREALLWSAMANTTHGLRRTHADKRHAVETLLGDAEWGRWSDREIARRCGVSADLVAAVRLTVGNDSDPSARTFTTKHGTVATMDIRRIGKHSANTPSRRGCFSGCDWSVVVGDAWSLAAVPPTMPVQTIGPVRHISAKRGPITHASEFGHEATVDAYVARLTDLFDRCGIG